MHDWKASLDRVLRTLSGSRRIDKVPYFAIIDEQMITRINGINVRTLFSSPKIYAKAALIANEFLNTDFIFLPTVYAGPVEAVAFAEVNDRMNCVKWFDYQPIFVEQGGICKTEEDIERLKIPDHSNSKLWNTTFEASKILYEKTQFPQNLGLGIWSVDKAKGSVIWYKRTRIKNKEQRRKKTRPRSEGMAN